MHGNSIRTLFYHGIPIVLYQAIVVTKDDLVAPFEIPISGGCIDILDSENLSFITFPFMYGYWLGSKVTPVFYGQSIVHQKFYIYDV